MISVYRKNALTLNQSQVGKTHLVLIDGYSRRSNLYLQGRNDQNIRVIIPDEPVPKKNGVGSRKLQAGDFVAVQVYTASSQILKALPLYITSIQEFYGENMEHVAIHI